MKTAVIDVGTNSVRLLIVDGRPSEHRDLSRTTIITRLGEGLRDDGELGRSAIERTIAVLKDFAGEITAQQVTKYRAVATAAVRRAANASQFVSEVKARTGLPIDVISAADEGRLAFLGATSTLGEQDPVLLIDVGGGSTEMIQGKPGGHPEVMSLEIGSVSLTERFLHSDPPAAPEIERAKQYLGTLLSRFSLLESESKVVGVAGTITTLAAVAQSLKSYDPSMVHGYVLTRAALGALLDRFLALTLEERRQLAGLEPKRADVIIGGTLILLEILEGFSLDELEVSEKDLLDGLLLDAFQNIWNESP